MIIWYGGAGQDSALKLVGWLVSNLDAKVKGVRDEEKLPAASSSEFVVGWGRRLPVKYPKSLNGRAPIGNKLRELTILLGEGLPVPGVSTNKVNGWFARMHTHKDGDDLLSGLSQGDFYVEPVTTKYEFRANVFGGKVFRTGLKQRKPGIVPKEVNGFPIRTGANGWTWTYSQSALDSTNTNRGPMRELAARAVQALGYDFGAVDMGYTTDGKWVIFEVNSAPMLEGDDIERYGNLILQSSKGA